MDTTYRDQTSAAYSYAQNVRRIFNTTFLTTMWVYKF